MKDISDNLVSSSQSDLASSQAAQVFTQLAGVQGGLPGGFVFTYRRERSGQGRFLYVSAGVQRTNGLSPEQVLESADCLFNQVPAGFRNDPFELPEFSAGRDAVTTRTIPFESTGRPSGRVWLEFHSRVSQLEDQALLWQGLALDVSERQRARQRYQLIRRVYADLGRINRSMLQSDSEDQLLELVCRIPVESGLMAMAWVAQLNPDSGALTPRFQFGIHPEYLQQAQISIRTDRPEGQGPCGCAWREGRAVVINDFRQNSATRVWHPAAQEFGWNSSACFPLFRKGQVFSLLSVYHLEADFFDEDVLALLQTVVNNLELALDRLDDRQALLASEARNRALIGGIPDLVFENRRTGEFLFAHAPEPRLFLLPPEKFLGHRVDEVFPDPLASQMLDAFQRSVDSAQLQEINYSLLIDGVMRYYEARISNISEDRVLTLVRDITSRRKAESELLGYRDRLQELVEERTEALTQAMDKIGQSELKLRAIFESAYLGLAMVRRGRVERCNFRAEDILGYSQGELAGLDAGQIFPDRLHFLQFRRRLLQSLRAGAGHREEQQVLQKNGSLIWVRLAVNQLEASDTLVAVVEDITEQRASAQAQQAARELAESATRMKSEFLANMSHEIRTPLNALTGLTHLLLQTEVTPRQLGYLQKMQVASQHLLSVINDILDISKVEAGKLTLESVEFEVVSVFANVLGLLKPKALDKGLQILLDLDPEVPGRLLGDPVRLEQILLNYGSNAVKFTERGQVTLTLRLLDRSEHQVELLFQVRDTGPGLTVEQCQGLFQTFHQGDSSITRRFGGSGLGLSICKNLASLMGGQVGVESLLGQGSTFWLQVRLGLGSQVGTAAGAVEASRPAPGQLSLGGRRVLLVEDNAMNREVATELLQSYGLQVDLAEDGLQALDRVRSQAYELVLMDLQMPVMDGLRAAREIRKLPGLQDLPVLAMTANAMQADIQLCLEAGMNDHIGKPVDPAQLRSKLLLWLKPAEDGLKRPEVPSPSDSAQALEVPLPEDIPGLKVELGLKYVQNDRALYLKLLRRFVDTMVETASKLPQAMQAGDGATSLRLVHTLKGLCGTMGAEDLQRHAAGFEQILRSGVRDVREAQEPMAGLLEEMLRLHARLKNWLPARPVALIPVAGPGAKVEDLIQALEEFRQLLTSGSYEAQHYLDDHGPTLQPCFGSAFPSLCAAVASFDYLAALELVEDAHSALKSSCSAMGGPA
ncbi:response regulator [bacterium]|nr:response regulator [bacterium]